MKKFIIFLSCLTCISFVLGLSLRTDTDSFNDAFSDLSASSEDLYIDLLTFRALTGVLDAFRFDTNQELHWDGHPNPDTENGLPPIAPYYIYFTNGLDPSDPDFEMWVIVDGLPYPPNEFEYQELWKMLHRFEHSFIAFEEINSIDDAYLVISALGLSFKFIFCFLIAIFSLLFDTVGLVFSLVFSLFHILGF